MSDTAPDTDDAVRPESPATVDEVRLIVRDLLQIRPGALRMCDALVKVAAEIAEQVAGPASTAAWLERAAADIRIRQRTARPPGR